MSVFLGAVKGKLKNKEVNFEDVLQWKTIKLQRLEDILVDYYRSRKGKISNDEIFSSNRWEKTTNAWITEVESIMKKHNYVPNWRNWFYYPMDLVIN